MEDTEKRLLEIKKELKQGDVLKEALKAEGIVEYERNRQGGYWRLVK